MSQASVLHSSDDGDRGLPVYEARPERAFVRQQPTALYAAGGSTFTSGTSWCEAAPAPSTPNRGARSVRLCRVSDLPEGPKGQKRINRFGGK
jgi:hypothetical protein